MSSIQWGVHATTGLLLQQWSSLGSTLRHGTLLTASLLDHSSEAALGCGCRHPTGLDIEPSLVPRRRIIHASGYRRSCQNPSPLTLRPVHVGDGVTLRDNSPTSRGQTSLLTAGVVKSGTSVYRQTEALTSLTAQTSNKRYHQEQALPSRYRPPAAELSITPDLAIKGAVIIAMPCIPPRAPLDLHELACPASKPYQLSSISPLAGMHEGCTHNARLRRWSHSDRAELLRFELAQGLKMEWLPRTGTLTRRALVFLHQK